MFSTTSIIIISLASLSFISTFIGVILALFFKKSVRGIVIGIGFSTGIMLLISFFELVPESLEEIGFLKTIFSLGVGMVLIGALNFIIPHTHLIKERGKKEKR